MRIIGGKHGGRVLQVPKGLPVRPTTDRTKEALFNILSHQLYWEETRVLDLFCGTGNISLECLSRGAEDVLSVDKHPRCIRAVTALKKNLNIHTGKTLCMDVWKFLRQCKDSYDFIFLDPPYALPRQEELLHLIFEREILAEDGLLVLEHSSTLSFATQAGFDSLRKYGSSHLSFFKKKDGSEVVR